jgi:hypothetical protein
MISGQIKIKRKIIKYQILDGGFVFREVQAEIFSMEAFNLAIYQELLKSDLY